MFQYLVLSFSTTPVYKFNVCFIIFNVDLYDPNYLSSTAKMLNKVVERAIINWVLVSFIDRSLNYLLVRR